MRRRARLAVLLVAGAPAVAGCATIAERHRDWTSYDGPGAAYFHAEEVEFPSVADPLEPLNRVTAKVNYELLRWVIAPSAKVYRGVVPGPVRTRAGMAFENLLFPTRFANNLLQGKLREGGVEAARFAINTTVGLLGLFDPAQGSGLHPYPEDFGQTFATWGWKPSTYVFLPFLGPSTLRDGVGEIPDAFIDPAFYFFPASLVRGYNKLGDHVEADLRTVDSAYDAYEVGRTLYTLQREVDVADFEWHADESGPTQTLSAIFLAPRDADFAARAETEHARIDGARPALPYSLWLQPAPAPLMYVVPGFGGNRLSDSAVAIAEIAFERGHSVVVVSNPTNWEFMRFGAGVTVPGFGPVDAHDVHVALSAIDRELEARLPGRFRARRLAGISLGAYSALWIAAGRDREASGAGSGARRGSLLEFELYLALNPPVSIEHALLQLDRFYNAPLAFPPEERAERIEAIFAKALYLSNGDLQPGMELPFTELESRFLIGMAFRLDLQYMILQSQELFDSKILLTRRSRLNMAPAFREAARYSYMEYLYAFVLPYFADREDDITSDEAGARRLFERSDLHAAADALRDSARVRVFTNENDFLLRPEDVAWLRETLGDRLTLSEQGGHLGNLYSEYMQSVIGAKMDQGAGDDPAGDGGAP
jgi:ABC-type transporter lipoprotein component MlaA